MEWTPAKVVSAVFFRLASGTEPVRDWLRSLGKDDRYLIGCDIKSIEFGWPIGMPLVRKLEAALWEARCNITQRRTVRILFTIREGKMVLLHGFIKKSARTPLPELELARKRLESIRDTH